MSRNVIVIGGLSLVVLGALVGLWLLLMKNDGASARTSARPPVVDRAPDDAAAPQGGTTTTPGIAAPTPVPAPGSGDNPREYQVGGTTVRDHRGGDRKPLDIPPNVHEPGGHAIQSTTTNAVSMKVQAVMKQCAASIPKESRGDKPRVEGQLTVAIKDKQVKVTGATVQPRNFADEAAGQLKQCMEQKSIGLADSVSGEADVADYTINISFAVP